MPSGGHNKKPTALRVLEGNPGKRPLPVNEPKPAPIAPTCPSWLGKEARKEWRRLAPLLHRLNLLTQLDRGDLAAYCDSYGRMVEAAQELAKLSRGAGCYNYPQKDAAGVLVGIKTGEWAQVRMIRKCKEEMTRYSAKFGLSPVDRARMSVPTVGEGDSALEALLTRPRPLGGRVHARPDQGG